MSILFGCGLIWEAVKVVGLGAGSWQGGDGGQSKVRPRRMTQSSCLTRRVQGGKRLQPYRCRWESGCHVGYWFRVDQIRDNQGGTHSDHVSFNSVLSISSRC